MTRRIDTVRRVRAIQERVARAEVGARQSVLATRRRASEASWAGLAARSQATGVVDVGAFRTTRELLRGGVEVAQRADAAVEVAGADVSAALDEWQVTARRLDGIERLADRHAEAERLDEERAARVELDDLVAARRLALGDADRADGAR